MSSQPVRSYLVIAAAIIIAALVISAAALSYSSLEATVTKTLTTSTTTTSTLLTTTTVTTTSTITCIQGTVTSSPSGGLPSNSTNNCQLGVTLGIATNRSVSLGQNETVVVSLTNDLTTPSTHIYTGLPILPHGLNLMSSYVALGDAYPVAPSCPPPPGYLAVGIAIYNSSGAYLQLNDAPPNALACVTRTTASGGPDTSYSFNSSQSVTKVLSIGGHWTSKDASEPWINATYSQFSPGNYTVVAFDGWQQFVELSFTVSGTPVAAGYDVTFQQVPCGGYYAVPWSVTLGSETVVMPANATVPGAGSSELRVDPGASTIIFTVPPGSYPYNILPTAGFPYPDITSGTVTVTSADVAVKIDAQCHP